MKHVDEERLETDLDYRYAYLTEFFDFGDDDVAAIRGLIPRIGSRVDAIIEKTYEKLLAFDATARHFVQRGAGYDGPLPSTAEELSGDHEQVRFRKNHLRTYVMQLLGKPYDGKMARYLDRVGKMHTPHSGSAKIQIPQAQMNAFLGLLSNILLDEVSALKLSPEETHRAFKALTKVIWIQNDLVNRHYARPLESAPEPVGRE